MIPKNLRLLRWLKNLQLYILSPMSFLITIFLYKATKLTILCGEISDFRLKVEDSLTLY